MQSDSMRNKIILIGFMGTGKSSVASQLSQLLQIPKVDVDAEIVNYAGREISEIFAQDGEEAFRNIESETLLRTLQSPETAVIATGGGAVLKELNRKRMLKYGLVVQLSASPEIIISRVQHDTSRPLLQGDVKQRVHQLLKDRAGIYDFAHITIDTTHLSLDEVVTRIVHKWHQAKMK